MIDERRDIIKALIIDGYIDEPAALGVPPYISPQIRYAAGALAFNGIESKYLTIDQIREKNNKNFNDYDYLIIICGTTVPGHYLRGTPINLNEIKQIFDLNKYPLKIIGGPITKGYTITGGKSAKILKDYLYDTVDFIVEGALENFLLKYPISNDYSLYEGSNYEIIDKVSLLGSYIVKTHPYYPDIIAEIEISKGCDRTEGFCNFCTEPIIYGKYKEREVASIVEEIKNLKHNGVANFRFGRSANFLAYGITYNKGKANSKIFEELYSEARKYSNILHTDNANPKFIIDNIEESKKILEIITKYNTSGDVLSFGVESFDEEVCKKNNINHKPHEILEAIRIVNEIGSCRDMNNVPKLLPGINLLYGLDGESKNTFLINKKYLDQIMKENLLLRRINVRQVMRFPDTKLYQSNKKNKVNKKEFNSFKNNMDSYNNNMLKKVFPMGTKLDNIIIEKNKGDISFGRQLGTYPILCGVSKKIDKYEKINGIVVNHGFRSLTVVERPLSIQKTTRKEWESIKGIGKKTAEKINFDKSFNNIDENQLEIINLLL